MSVAIAACGDTPAAIPAQQASPSAKLLVRTSVPDRIAGALTPFAPAFVIHQVSAPSLTESAKLDRPVLQPVWCDVGDCGADYVVEVSIHAQTLAAYQIDWAVRAGDRRESGTIVRDAAHIRSFGSHLPYGQAGLFQTAIGADLNTIGQVVVRHASAWAINT